MARYVSIGVVVLLLAGATLLLVIKTAPPPSVDDTAAFSTGTFGSVSLRIEFATTTAARELGLGNRTTIPNHYGMLFVFPKDDFYGFWMKDTLVPLDMFWLDSQGHVVFIAPDVLPASYPNVFYPSVPARYVLETAAGFATQYGIATGTPLLLKNIPTVSE
jgi:uncharacterized membrane protein (UPF0127 family)